MGLEYVDVNLFPYLKVSKAQKKKWSILNKSENKSEKCKRKWKKIKLCISI
jgi:hypothetical protein